MDSSFKAGQTITISLPMDTPHSVLTYLDQLKGAGERTYNRKAGQLFVESVSQACSREKPGLLLPFPEDLSEEQQDWLNHPYTRQILSKWIFQVILDHSPSALLFRSLDNLKDDKIVMKPQESTEVSTESPPDNQSFEISTSYHSNLVGYFMNDD
ncbi:MAG: hypothetical protein K6T94_24795 [Paenibacillus sp.]|nr:hypothetical protein [Paenibacillus sp.]